MKKRIIIYALIVAILFVASFVWYSNRVIGKLSGIENEKVVFNNGSSYVICDDYHTHKDKGWILGKIIGAYDTSYYVFTVRGEPLEEYIYVAAMGQGDFYKRVD